MNAFEQARSYIAKEPPAISGQGGHNQTYHVACLLIWGFGLSHSEALTLLKEYNLRCIPQWTEKELEHKINDAEKTVSDKPKGYLVSKTVTKETKLFSLHKNTKNHFADKLPEPIPDGARELIKHAFQQGEGVRIAYSKINEEEKEVPLDAGTVLSREEWLKKLDEKNGDPNGIYWSAKKTGIYIGINPMRPGGSKDQDVTAFRHALIEFDNISPEEQWRIYKESNIPCTAIIFSGGKSLHAWVNVDAKNRQEYDDRIKQLYSYFEKRGYQLDRKNKNPSRFSRLPNCVRFNKRQELIAINVGAESFTQWLTDVADAIDVRNFSYYDQYDTENDPNCLIGKRWLCRGGSCLLVGSSGIGKSSLAVQIGISWALGKDCFGIPIAEKYSETGLKVLLIQAENDDGDNAEILRGVVEGMGLNEFENKKEFELLNNNFFIYRDATHTGFKFIENLQRLIDRYRPDIVILDPLLSFVGGDISKQEVCGQFLRNWLNPIAQASGCAWLCVHHTGKPSTDKDARKNWVFTDWAYLGLGSSELVNWTRAAMILRQIDQDHFELRLAKRGSRACAKTLNGYPTNIVYLKHNPEYIHWIQCDEPEKDNEKDNEQENSSDFDTENANENDLNNENYNNEDEKAKQRKWFDITRQNLYSFFANCPEGGETKEEFIERLRVYLANLKPPIKRSANTIRAKDLRRLFETKKIKTISKNNKNLIVKGENA